MAPHQERVIEEKTELDEKIGKLTTFVAGPIFAKLPTAEQDRLDRQLGTMQMYSNILGERIAAFEQE